MARDLEARLATRLGLKRGTLETRVGRARADMPRAVRSDALTVAAAARAAGHPRLAAATSGGAVQAAHARVAAFLDGPAPDEARRRRRLRLAALVAARVLAVGALTIAVLAWRGFV